MLPEFVLYRQEHIAGNNYQVDRDIIELGPIKAYRLWPGYLMISLSKERGYELAKLLPIDSEDLYQINRHDFPYRPLEDGCWCDAKLEGIYIENDRINLKFLL